MLAILLFVNVLSFRAQSQDSIFQVSVQKNLAGLQAWSQLIVSNPGSVSFVKTDNPAEEFSALDWKIFAEPIPGFSSFFSFTEHLSANDKQQLISALQYYQPLFLNELQKAGLPDELQFLPVALSILDNGATGKEKRAGLWQLTHFQAVLNGLEVNRLVDERFDAGKATRAAISEIKRLISAFDSDELAVLAYLSGPTRLRNIPDEDKEISVTETLEKLPSSVSETLTFMQALAVFLSENQPINTIDFNFPDTVFTARQLHFRQLEQTLNIPEKTLALLNPQYPYLIIPAENKSCAVYLPKGKKDEYRLLQDSVFQLYDSTLFEVVAQKIEYPPAPTRQYVGEKVKDLEIEGKTKIKYTLKSGDVLGFIAEDYDVQVEDLKYWNNISNERKIQAGQKLDIFVNDEDADYYRKLHPEPLTKSGQKTPAAAVSYPIPENARKIEHEVKSGESPYVIAQKYKGVTPEAILYWNGISDARKIQIGQKITIYVSE